MAQWPECCWPVDRKLTSSLPCRSTGLGSRPGLQMRVCGRQPNDISSTRWCFFVSLPPSLPLSENKSFLKIRYKCECIFIMRNHIKLQSFNKIPNKSHKKINNIFVKLTAWPLHFFSFLLLLPAYSLMTSSKMTILYFLYGKNRRINQSFLSCGSIKICSLLLLV